MKGIRIRVNPEARNGVFAVCQPLDVKFILLANAINKVPTVPADDRLPHGVLDALRVVQQPQKHQLRLSGWVHALKDVPALPAETPARLQALSDEAFGRRDAGKQGGLR